ncbi:Ff.00g120040.m01.CDS01 [Fusarium sp. VM40]|nr:Ff.00g120040.m01.CDS01 [Fusarium sp. VM40]
MAKRSISDDNSICDGDSKHEQTRGSVSEMERKYKKRRIPKLDEIARKCTIDTHLSALDHRLTAQESFCELVQWWRGSIMESFYVQLVDFTVVRRERHEKVSGRTVTEILYKALDQSSLDKRELGYIQFLNTKYDKAGVVRIVNRQVTLQPENLLTKTQDTTSTYSTHSQFNLARAILNFVGGGTNHSVTCQSGGVNMNFNFNTARELVARVTRMRPDTISKSYKSASSRFKSHVPFYPRPSVDTILSIGEAGLGRSGNNEWIKRAKVSPGEFAIWCEAALFLQDIKEEGIIRTRMGDLILDVKYRDNLHLNGFLLHAKSKTTHASLSGKRLKYGYNIIYGTAEKEGKRICSLEDESKALIDLLNDWQWGDVELAYQFISRDAVVCLKDYLFKDTSKWHYRQNPQLDSIIASLGRQGGELRDSYWDILQIHGMVHTVEVEHQRRFITSKTVSIPDDEFARHISRALETCLYACNATQTIRAIFVQGSGLPLQVVYSKGESIIRIHRNWLSQEDTRFRLGLGAHKSLPDVVFLTSVTLLKDIIDQLPNELFCNGKAHELQLAEQRLLEYTRKYINSDVLSRDFIAPSRSKLADIAWEKCISSKSHAKYHMQPHQAETYSKIQ